LAAEDENLKEIANFQSADDKRIQDVYAKLIKMYQAAEAEKAENKAERTARNEMANIYAQFGYKDLYQIAAVIAEIKRVKTENEDIMSTVTKVFKDSGSGGGGGGGGGLLASLATGGAGSTAAK